MKDLDKILDVVEELYPDYKISLGDIQDKDIFQIINLNKKGLCIHCFLKTKKYSLFKYRLKIRHFYNSEPLIETIKNL